MSHQYDGIDTFYGYTEDNMKYEVEYVVRLEQIFWGFGIILRNGLSTRCWTLGKSRYEFFKKTSEHWIFYQSVLPALHLWRRIYISLPDYNLLDYIKLLVQGGVPMLDDPEPAYRNYCSVSCVYINLWGRNTYLHLYSEGIL